MSESLYWLWLSSETGVSPKSLNALLSYYGNAKAAFMAPAGEFYSIEGISRSDAAKLEAKALDKAEVILRQCVQNDITIVSRASSAYPHRLLDVFAPPSVLYIRGDLPDIDSIPVVSVVGTRKASEYGLKMARKIAYELAESGMTVASGLTAGIDAAGATGALYAQGKVIGVLGTAITAAKDKLSKYVEEHGALISEYPPGTQSLKAYFRARNRITAGISIATAAIEAPIESGTSLFVAEALAQGKEVYALPGNADSETGAGTLKMILDGARPIISGYDIACDYASRYKCISLSGASSKIPGELYTFQIQEPQKQTARASVKPEKNPEKEKRPVESVNIRSEFPGFNETQYSILDAIGTNELYPDEISARTQLPISAILSQLTILEIKGAIKRTPGKRIIINTSKVRK